MEQIFAFICEEGMLGGTYSADVIRFQTKKVVEKQGGSFVLDSAVRIDPYGKEVICRQKGRKIGYDVLSCNAGSYVPDNLLAASSLDTVFPVKPIEGLARAREQIVCRGKISSLRVVIVGGGPSSMELAGNIHQLAKKENLSAVTITIIAGHAILPHAPKRVRLLVERSQRRRGITILKEVIFTPYFLRLNRLDKYAHRFHLSVQHNHLKTKEEPMSIPKFIQKLQKKRISCRRFHFSQLVQRALARSQAS